MKAFLEFMRKVKRDELRSWLTLADLRDLLPALQQDANKCLYFLAHAERVGTIAKVDARSIVGELVYKEGTDVIRDINLACWMDTSAGGKYIVVEASLFMPEQGTVSRIFEVEADRDEYYDELIELNEALRESQVYAASLSIRKLLGGPNEPKV